MNKNISILLLAFVADSLDVPKKRSMTLIRSWPGSLMALI
jgi:hypothetical protein